MESYQLDIFKTYFVNSTWIKSNIPIKKKFLNYISFIYANIFCSINCSKITNRYHLKIIFFLSKFFCHIFIKRYQILFLIKKILKLYQPETVKYCCLELNFFTSYKLDIFEIIPPKLNFWKKFTRDFQSIHISTLKPHDPTRSIVQLLPFNFLQKCLEALTAQFELIIFDH